MLKVIDTDEIWTGQKVRGITYSLAIESKFTDEELLERGLVRVQEVQDIPVEEPKTFRATVSV